MQIYKHAFSNQEMAFCMQSQVYSSKYNNPYIIFIHI